MIVLRTQFVVGWGQLCEVKTFFGSTGQLTKTKLEKIMLKLKCTFETTKT
jgi:hypothetical protein